MTSKGEPRPPRVALRHRVAKIWKAAPLWKRALLVVSALPALLLLENLLLWSPLICLLIELAPPVTFDYGFAWSLIPGRVHLYDFEMTVEDRAIQMQLNADHVDTSIVVSELWSKKVYIDSATAQGLRVKVRPVLNEEQARADWVKTFPPIKGLADPPLWRHPERPYPPTEKLWKVRITGIDAQVDEVWIGPMHLRGTGHIQGGFELHPRTMLELTKARLRFGPRAGDPSLLIGEKTLSAQAAFELQAELPPFYFEKENHLLDLLQLRANAKFPFEDFSSLDPLLPHGKVEFEATDGEFEAALTLRNRRFEQRSGITFQAQQAALKLQSANSEYRLRGPLSTSALFRTRADGHHIDGELSWRELVVAEEDSKLAPSTIEEAFVSLDALLGKDFTITPQKTNFKIVGVEVPDLAILNPFLEETRFRVPLGSANMHVEGSAQGTKTASATLHLKSVGTSVNVTQSPGSKERGVTASFAASLISMMNMDFTAQQMDLNPVTLQMSPFSLSWGDHKISWPFVLSTTHTDLEFNPPHHLSYLNVEGPTLKPVLEAMLEKGLGRWGAKLVLGAGETKGRIRLERAGDVTRADLVSFTSGRVAVDGTALTSGENVKGAFLVVAPVLRIGVSLAEAEPQIHPTASRDWLEEELTRQGIFLIDHNLVAP